MRLLLVLSIFTCLGAVDSDVQLDLRIANGDLLNAMERMARDLDVSLVVHQDAIEHLDENKNKAEVDIRDAGWSKLKDFLEDEYRLAVSHQDGQLVVRDSESLFLSRTEVRWYDVRLLVEGVQHYYTERSSSFADDIEDTLDMDQLINMIELQVAEESWGRDGVSLTDINGWLVVCHIPEVQDKVRALLLNLEAAVARQVQLRVFELPIDKADGLSAVMSAESWQKHLAHGRSLGCFVVPDSGRNHLSALRIAEYMRMFDGDVPRPDKLIGGLSVDCEVMVSRRGIVLTTRLNEGEIVEVGKVQVTDANGDN